VGVRLAVALDVESGDVEEVRIVAEQAEPVVAPLAEQPADLAGRVIVIEVLWPLVAADPAPVLLRRTQIRQLRRGELVRAVEVARRVRRTIARAAPASEAGRCAGVADVVLVCHGLPA
jgi:hypothetical protein